MSINSGPLLFCIPFGFSGLVFRSSAEHPPSTAESRNFRGVFLSREAEEPVMLRWVPGRAMGLFCRRRDM